MSLEDNQRHDRITAWLQAHDKPTSVFQLKWDAGSGGLINEDVIKSTASFWYKKCGWSRAEIEAMFYAAQVEIKSGDCFDRSLQQVFGGEPGKRWHVEVEAEAETETKHNAGAHALGGGRSELVLALELTPRADAIWNALSNCGESNSVNFQQFMHNMEERGIHMSAQLAEPIFEQMAGSADDEDKDVDAAGRTVTHAKMDELLRCLDRMPVDWAKLSLDDQDDIYKFNVLLKRVLMAVAVGRPLNVNHFLTLSTSCIPTPYSLADWNTLVLRFAPKCYLYAVDALINNREQWLPSNIDFFLQRCTLTDKNDATFSIKQPTRAQIGQRTGESYVLDPQDYISGGVFYGDLDSASHYVRIQNAGSPVWGEHMIDLQYYLFYPYNGYAESYQKTFGAHEGDWEFVAVRVGNWWDDPLQATIEAVLDSRHGHAESVWLTKPATSASQPQTGHYSLEDGTHPVVYVAHGTHCNYESGGIKYRNYVDADECAELKTLPWHYPTSMSTEGKRANVVEIIQVEDDVYQVFCGADDDDSKVPKVPPQDWISYGGTWGRTYTYAQGRFPKTPPSTPKLDYYNYTTGYDAVFTLQGSFGSDYYQTIGTGSVALGLMGGDFCLAVGLSPHQADSDYLLYLYAGNAGGDGNLVRLGKAANGRSAQQTTGVKCVAIGNLGQWQRGLVALGWNTTQGHSRYELFERDTASSLRQVYVGGEDWNSALITNAIAFGFIGDAEADDAEDEDKEDGKHEEGEEDAAKKEKWMEVFGVCPGGVVDGNKVFMLYSWPRGASEPQEVAFGKLSDFGANAANYVKAIAFGAFGGKKVVAIGRAATVPSDARLYLYYYDVDAHELVLWLHTMNGFPQGVFANSVDVGLINDEQVVGVTTSAGVVSPAWGNVTACFFIYRYAVSTTDGPYLDLVYAGGRNWSGNATNISFGQGRSKQFFVVGRWQGGKYTKLMWYDSGFNETAVAGGDWDDDRGVTSVAAGWINSAGQPWLKEKSVIVYGLNAGGGHRGGVYRSSL